MDNKIVFLLLLIKFAQTPFDWYHPLTRITILLIQLDNNSA